MIPLQSRSFVRRVREKEADAAGLTDEALRESMQALKEWKPGSVRQEAFALACEACRRKLGFSPYDEQIIGADAMADGCIAQMKTGEGKTVTAVLAVCFFALSGKGAHIATVNSYLAERDCEWMRPVYELLGFTSGVTKAGGTAEEKKAAYACDVTYGTSSEFGFDYLRDRVAQSAAMQTQRVPAFMLVDEADSILLDEAVTPMLLSGIGGQLDPLLLTADRFVHWLKPVVLETLPEDEDYEKLNAQYDYIVLRREKVALLTSLGQKHAEQYFRIPNLSDDLRLMHLIYQAIQARGALRRDVDYIVQDGRLQIVDPNTGRVMDGRRYCNGLWQAIQVKERLNVVRESITVASVSYQQYFRRYPHLCGMTGTAWEGRREFEHVYHMPVCRIPPHRPEIRRDLPDCYAQSREEQIRLLAKEIEEHRDAGQPCLAVTRSVEDNERLSSVLSALGISHHVLNAKQHAEEAAVIAKAGQSGTVTVATALAGRGTDIRLDEQAKAAGGLYVLGLGHQDSRRGDRQLMGRSGRQGDPGLTRFFISPEDDLLQRYSDGETVTKKNCEKLIRHAQERCEELGMIRRETTLKLDEIVGRYREEVYARRDQILKSPLPEAYSGLPQALVRAVMLQQIDAAWAEFLAETEEAREGCNLVSLSGKNYEVAYVHEVTAMYEKMADDIQKKIDGILSGVKDGTLHVGNL